MVYHCLQRLSIEHCAHVSGDLLWSTRRFHLQSPTCTLLLYNGTCADFNRLARPHQQLISVDYVTLRNTVSLQCERALQCKRALLAVALQLQ